jgi:hypothetical protein
MLLFPYSVKAHSVEPHITAYDVYVAFDVCVCECDCG